MYYFYLGLKINHKNNFKYSVLFKTLYPTIQLFVPIFKSRKYVAGAIIVTKYSGYYGNKKRHQLILQSGGWLPGNAGMGGSG